MDIKENFSCRGMFSFNPHFADNCNVLTININNCTNSRNVEALSSDFVCHFLYNRNAKTTTLCVFPMGVAMGERGSGIHNIYFPGTRGLGIHEDLSVKYNQLDADLLLNTIN
jgi:hypothetical protein